MGKRKLLWEASVFFLALSVALLSVLTPCAGAAQKTAKPWPSTMVIAVTDPGSTAYILGVTIAKQIEEKLKIRATVTVAGTEERLRLVARGEADIGFSATDTSLDDAVRGVNTFAADGKQAVRYLLYQYPIPLTIIARADSHITKIPDLRGKRFMYIYKGSPAEYVIPALLEFHKMKPQDVTGLKMGTAAEGFNAILAGKADACVRLGARRGVGTIKEGAFKVDLVFLSLTQAEVDYVLKKYPFLGQFTMAPGIYKGQNHPVLTVTQGFHGIVHKDMPEDLAYAIAKILLDTSGPNTPGEFTKYHPDLDWTLESQKTGLNLAPLHPGLVKYLKDRKVWTADMEKAQQNILKIAK